MNLCYNGSNGSLKCGPMVIRLHNRAMLRWLDFKKKKFGSEHVLVFWKKCFHLNSKLGDFFGPGKLSERGTTMTKTTKVISLLKWLYYVCHNCKSIEQSRFVKVARL